MGYIDSNNITFNSFDGNISALGKKIGNREYAGATVNDLADIASDYNGKLPTTINVLDIDWNGGQLTKGDGSSTSNRTINTTGDLLDVINKQQEQIYILASAIVALQNQIS